MINLMKKQPKMKVQTSRKMDANREAKSHHFSSKTRHWAKQGRLIHSLCLIFEGSKNRRFFDADLEGQKINKNRALDAQGPKKVLRVVARWSQGGRFPASMALGPPRARSRIKRNEETRKQGTCDWV